MPPLAAPIAPPIAPPPEARRPLPAHHSTLLAGRRQEEGQVPLSSE